MARSAALRAADVRDLIRLVGECRDLGDDRLAWRRHLLGGLAGMVGADMALTGEMAGCRALKNVDLGVHFWWPHGLEPPPFWPAHIARFRRDGGYSPVLTDYHRLNGDAPGRALARRDFVADRDWYRSHDFLNVQNVLGVDHTLFCFRPIAASPPAADEHTGIVLTRLAGRPDFAPRDRTIVRETHAAIAPLVGGALARFVEPAPSDLPPRTRQVLACLLEGEGDKQIALRLGLSPHTVNQHTKAIYRHFGVQGRAELLARWIRRGWRDRFAWEDPDAPPAGPAG